jgi:hypothetical protein
LAAGKKIMQLLTVVHFVDIPQLLLQAKTIKKFWKDTKLWTIVIEDEDPTQCLEACEIIKHFMKDWNINVIVPNSNLKASGWIRQQLFKLWYTALSSEEWVLILDCKNFLIRPMNQRSLVINNKVKHIPVFSLDEFTLFAHNAAKEKLKVVEEIPISSSMTPCVCNSLEAKALVVHLGITLDTWVEGGATEFSLYWIWTYKKFKYKKKQYVSGFWDEIEDKNLAKSIAHEAVKNNKFLIWVHHRYVYNDELRNLTKYVLSSIGITKHSLLQWDNQYQQVLTDNEHSIKQDRSKWKDLLK